MHNRKLGRTSDHRKSMLRNLATDMIVKGKIETTEMKAQELKSVVDKFYKDDALYQKFLNILDN